MTRSAGVRAVLIALLGATGAHANDSSFGGSGADLVPLKETRIRMVSEVILIELRQDPAPRRHSDTDSTWHVHARYEFHNPTREKIALTLGFPESRCGGNGEDCFGRGGEFLDMMTSVDGKRVPQRTGEVPRRSEWGAMLGRVFLYSVQFAPGQTVRVEHRYRYDRSPHVMGEYFSYLTRTGNLWAAPIGRAKFTVRLPDRPWFVTTPSTYNVVSYTEGPRAKGPGGITEIVFEMTDFSPVEDLDLYFATTWASGLIVFDLDGHCPVVHDGEINGEFALDRRLAEKCRYLPLALHGAPLPAPFDHFFYGPRELSEEERLYAEPIQDRKQPRVLRLQPNARYTPALLTKAERTYMARAEEAIAKSPIVAPSAAPSAGSAAAPSPAAPSSAAPVRATPSATPAPSSQPAAPPTRGCGSCATIDAGPGAGPLASALALLLAALRVGRRAHRSARTRMD